MNLKNSLLVSILCIISLGLFAQEKPKQITLFTNVQVFDVTSDSLIKADVLVEGNLIKQISIEGAFVDIIIVNGDATKDIKLLMDANNIGFIMKDGKTYKNTIK